MILSVTSLSCAVTDFIGAYFNTYYNARQLFTEAETDANTQFDARPGGKNLLAPCAIQPATKTKFASVIEKCSKLLQYHPESKLVDDALMMIGKAYYYSDEDQKADRKFREIIDTYPDGGLALEAKLFLSYALYRMNNIAGARAMAGQVIAAAEKDGEEEMIARASLLVGRMEFEAENYPAAAEAYTRAGENGASAQQRSAAYLLVADMARRMSRYADAEKAFRRAEQESDTYIGEYRGRMGILRMRALQGEYEGALEGMRGLRSESNNKEFFGEIELEIAHTLGAMGDTAAAIEQYTRVDTTYARTEVSANAYFALGKLYETGLHRYDAAQSAYAKARSEYPQAAVTAEATRRAEYLLRFFQYHREIARYDSLRNAALAAPAPSTRVPAGRDSAAAARAGGDTLRAGVAPAPAIPLDTLTNRLAANKSELAGLFYATIGLPDSAEQWYRRVVDDHPRSPFVPRALFSLAQIYGRDTLASRSRPDSLLRLIIASYPESDFAAESRRLLGLPAVKKASDEAEVMYARGEKLLMSGKPEAAVDTFKTLARRYPASPYSSRALYAVGWIYENGLTRADSAIAAYEYLITLYPGSPLAQSVEPKIAEVKLHRAADRAANDTSAVAPAAKPTDEEEILRRRREERKKATPAIPPKPAVDQKKPEGKEGPIPE